MGRVYLLSLAVFKTFIFLFSLSFFLFPFAVFFSMIPSAASTENPSVSYYSSVVRHCAHRTKHHGDSPAALSARNIWQYPNERSTEETTWEEILRRKVGRIKKERAQKRLHPRRNM